MKIKLLSILIFFSVFFSNAQTITNKTILDIDCPPPKEIDYRLLCGDIATKTEVDEKERKYYQYFYEKRILELSCVNVEIDDEETIKRKVQLFWSSYKTKCNCDSVTFNVPNGNILKFSISKNTPDFIDTLVLNYDLDINFIDPVDNRNLLDYVIDEIEKMKTNGTSKTSIKVYEKYRDSIISIGGKPSK